MLAAGGYDDANDGRRATGESQYGATALKVDRGALWPAPADAPDIPGQPEQIHAGRLAGAGQRSAAASARLLVNWR